MELTDLEASARYVLKHYAQWGFSHCAIYCIRFRSGMKITVPFIRVQPGRKDRLWSADHSRNP